MNKRQNDRYKRLEVARLTPVGRGAVACVGVRGENAWSLFRERWSRAGGILEREDFDRWAEDRSERPYFGLFRFDEIGGASDEIVLRRRTASSFEIDCHGGDVVCSRLIRYFGERGAEIVASDEWERAVELEEANVGEAAFYANLNSRVESAFYAAADALVANVTTDRAAKIAVAQRGAWRAFFDELQNDLALDRPRYDLAIERIDDALKTSSFGRFLIEPVVVALLGAPNVGKSSLLNAALGYDRAVVSETSGTTRDLVSASLVFNGWNFRLVDAAGLRETDDAIERAGTKLAAKSALGADLALIVYDPTLPRDAQNAVFSKFLGASSAAVANKSVCVLNKIDLPESKWDSSWRNVDPTTSIRVSAKTIEGLDALTDALTDEALGEFADDENGLFVWTSEQVVFLKELRELCANENAVDALNAILN